MYKESVEWYFKRFKRYADKRWPNNTLSIDSYKPGTARLYCIENDGGSHFSPRLPAREFKIYLDAMCNVWDTQTRIDNGGNV